MVSACRTGVADSPPLLRRVHSGLRRTTRRLTRPTCWNQHRGANVNLLTSKDDIDVVTGMARFSGIPVSVHPGEGTIETMEAVL
jgi:hypothetical protein